MRKPLAAWSIAVALTTVGSIWAHELTYRIVAPDPDAKALLLARTGHGYLDHAPLVLGVAVALALLGFGLRALASFRGRPTGAPPSWPFALLPLIGFALQEHLERFLHSGDLPLTAALEPTFLLGIGLQLPFALAALALARALLGLAERLGHALGGHAPASLRRRALLPIPAGLDNGPRAPKLSLGYGERGPPLLQA
jgi:hypothetical protein